MRKGRVKGSAFEELGQLVTRHICPASAAYRNEIGDRPTIHSNPQVLSRLDLTKHSANSIAQFPLRDSFHAIIVAHLLQLHDGRRTGPG